MNMGAPMGDKSSEIYRIKPTVFQRGVIEKALLCYERQIKTTMLSTVLELPIEQLWSPILIGLINFFNF